MKFWIFMFVMNLLTPLVMIIYGRIYEKKPPQKPKSNFAYSGYRTKMSMINIETWEYAHRFFGKLWFRFGIVLGVTSIIVLLFVIGRDKDTIGFVGMIVCYVQIVVMILPAIPTEMALRKNFDKNGKRKIL